MQIKSSEEAAHIVNVEWTPVQQVQLGNGMIPSKTVNILEGKGEFLIF